MLVGLMLVVTQLFGCSWLLITSWRCRTVLGLLYVTSVMNCSAPEVQKDKH